MTSKRQLMRIVNDNIPKNLVKCLDDNDIHTIFNDYFMKCMYVNLLFEIHVNLNYEDSEKMIRRAFENRIEQLKKLKIIDD